MPSATTMPNTLGEKLTPINTRNSFPSIIVFLVLSGVVYATWWWSHNLLYVGIAALGSGFALITQIKKPKTTAHFLIHHDQNNLISSLNLSEKTVLIDGNNIYHFGLRYRVGRQALRALIFELLADGFRVVCFFDANIYFTLRDNKEFRHAKDGFSHKIINDVFGLNDDEIFIVPSGIQADTFIVETAAHLPKSTVISNDKYRDFERQYRSLFQEKSWRKGVSIENGQLFLFQYKFDYPVMLRKPAA